MTSATTSATTTGATSVAKSRIASGQVATVAILAPGEMGSAIGHALGKHGIEVLTSLSGRGAASAARASQAGFTVIDSDDELVARSDLILSVVPPGMAEDLAQRLLPALHRAVRKPAFADCNAVAPATVVRIADQVAESGCSVIDVALFGGPTSGKPGVVMYASGLAAQVLQALHGKGVTVRVMDGPVGAASALKLSYAGINKGFTALGALMALSAVRSNATAEMIELLSDTQPAIMAYIARFVPAMFPKAWRWEPEMREIADFLGNDPSAAAVFSAFAEVYGRLGEQATNGGTGEIALLRQFCSDAKDFAASARTAG